MSSQFTALPLAAILSLPTPNNASLSWFGHGVSSRQQKSDQDGRVQDGVGMS